MTPRCPVRSSPQGCDRTTSWSGSRPAVAGQRVVKVTQLPCLSSYADSPPSRRR
jgi:hypothetical protein